MARAQLALPGMVGETEGRCGLSCSGSTAASDCEKSPRTRPSSTSSIACGTTERSAEETMSSCSSPTQHWSDREETLIIFDWDDTLCPTSLGAGADERALRLLARHVEQVLRTAAALGRVEIVSTADAGRVEEGMARYLPSIRGVLEELRISISFAGADALEAYVREARGEGGQWRSVQKATAKAMRMLYRSAVGGESDDSKVKTQERGWKNFLSIGTSTPERLASQESRSQPKRRRDSRSNRCKLVKMKFEPTVEELAAQLRRVAESLLQMVHHKGDLDLEFRDEEVREALAHFGTRS